ncbi:MAG: hypothetical protein R3F62_14420 [Planctomycetota bacterium]
MRRPSLCAALTLTSLGLALGAPDSDPPEREVRSALEGYALPRGSVAAVASALEALRTSPDPEATTATLELATRACALLADLDLRQARLAAQEQRLEERAQRRRSRLSAEDRETRQRQLELTRVKLRIQGAQRARLAALRDALLDTVAGLRVPAEPSLCSAAAEAAPELAAAALAALARLPGEGAREALRAGLASPPSRAALCRRLGRDLGPDPDPWRAAFTPSKDRP